jgi:hypothetical protein
MSDAWRGNVPVWSEPVWASVIRVAQRGLLAGLLATLALLVPERWAFVATFFAVLSVFAFFHAVLAIANLARNKGVLLQLTGSGTLEWPQSLQEIWLRRPVDWVDGKEILVVSLEGMGVPSRTEPRVTLKGATQDLVNLPLYRTSVEDFADQVNARIGDRGVTVITQRRR